MSLFDVLVAVAVVFAEIQEGARAGIEAAPPPPFPQKSTTSLECDYTFSKSFPSHFRLALSLAFAAENIKNLQLALRARENN